MKSVLYALLCFIFIVSSHAQDVEANLMNRCTRELPFPGKCGSSEDGGCIKLYSSEKKLHPSRCECEPRYKARFCRCKIC
uniref:S-locus pollen protein n=1 Tax=Brassica campestris TaxID=3711 RepID=Q9MB54_BRACM|nr:S-locus pollen protein [Brassica rapa]